MADSKNANKRVDIPVMFSFDNNYVIPAAVALYSLLDNANKKHFYKLYVLHSNITIENQNKLKQNIESFSDFSSLEFIDMENKLEKIWLNIKIKGHFSKETMSKVLAASFFPQYEKIITSDVDVVFMDDISDSYLSFSVEEDYYLAGVKAVGKIIHYMDNYKDRFSDEEIKKLSGFCGGYIVFNLKKLRADNMEREFIKCFEDNGYRINQMEQDVLNLCCYPKTKALHLKYVTCSYMWDMYKDDDDFRCDINYSEQELREAMAHPIQLHYATSVKPWKNVDSVKSEEWFKYVVRTPFLEQYLAELPKKIVTPTKEGISEIVRLTKKLISNYVHKLVHSIKKILLALKKDPFVVFRYDIYRRIFRKIYFRSKNADIDLLILDDSFPSKDSSFRYSEFTTYLYEFMNSMAVLTNDSYCSPGHDVLVKNEKNVDSYTKECPIFQGKISTKLSTKKSKLAISVFLNNIYNNLPLLEQKNIPFVFTLYPGGGFALNDPDSDKKLIEVFSSKLFRRVIVTQKVTYSYLIDNKLCLEDKIKYIYGGVVDNYLLNIKRIYKKRYGYDKDIFDICFVGHRYTAKGIDKGYDVFINFAKMMAKKHKNVNFHVVGEFTNEDVDIDEIKNKIKFYGVKESVWFKDFYINKDLVISPNRPFVLSEGSFDGFPLTCSLEAMLNKVALFCTDDLNLNTKFIDGKDLVIINHNAQDILEKVEYYYNNPSKLLSLSENGYKSVKKYYSFNQQMKPRVKLIKEELKNIKKDSVIFE